MVLGVVGVLAVGYFGLKMMGGGKDEDKKTISISV